MKILILSDGSEDPDTTPFLEIADQKGNPLKIPHQEKKVSGVFWTPDLQVLQVLNLGSVQALILAMGFHEKGRSLMKRRQHDDALCHLLQADQEFR